MYYYYLLTNKAFKGKKINDFEYDKLSSEEITEIVLRSKVLVDAQFPKNTGLTMRTIEALGMKRKLITANADIVNYDFYDPNNINVVDRKYPLLNRNFIKSNYVDVPEGIYKSYNINNWIRRLLCT